MATYSDHLQSNYPREEDVRRWLVKTSTRRKLQCFLPFHLRPSKKIDRALKKIFMWHFQTASERAGNFYDQQRTIDSEDAQNLLNTKWLLGCRRRRQWQRHRTGFYCVLCVCIAIAHRNNFSLRFFAYLLSAFGWHSPGRYSKNGWPIRTIHHPTVDNLIWLLF